MRIDGIALRRELIEQINAIINGIWADGNTQTVDKEGLIQGSWGPDCIEMLNGGDDWLIHDRHPETNAIVCRDGRTTHIAHHSLFEACAKHAPHERITWHQLAVG